MNRKVEFLPDGKRKLALPEDIVRVWKRHSDRDPRFALGTSDHESSLTLNEKDTEPSGFVSMGIYQISEDEMRHVGMPEADPYDLEDCTIVFAKLTEEREVAICRALPPIRPTDSNYYEAMTRRTVSMPAYLFIAHNQGLAACLKSIRTWGMNWESYKSRNEDEAKKALAAAQESGDKDRIKAAQDKLKWWYDVFAYGNDVISGGRHWTDDFYKLVG